MNSKAHVTGIGLIRFVRTALLIIFSTVVAYANAASPVSGGFYANYSGTSGYTYPVFSTKAAACSHLAAWIDGQSSSTVETGAVSGDGVFCQIFRGGSNVANYTFGGGSYCEAGGAPDTSKPLDQQCPEVCPSAGTSAGSWNLTTAWTNGPELTSKVQKRVIPDGGLMSQLYSDGQCAMAPATGPTACYQSQVPSLTGLYRISCDVPLQYTGSPLTATPDNNPSTPPLAPACPGTTGTVNGKTVCLDSPTSQPQNTTPYPTPGNPVPGPSGGGSNGTSVDPATGTGSGDSPGTTTGSGGTTVPNSGTTAGGTGVTVNVPDTVTIRENGVPNGEGAYNSSKTALDTVYQEAQTSLATVTSDTGKDTSWGWMPLSWVSPGSCEPVNLGTLPVIEVSLDIDLCPALSTASEFISFMWAFGTIWLCIQMVWVALNGGN